MSIQQIYRPVLSVDPRLLRAERDIFADQEDEDQHVANFWKEELHRLINGYIAEDGIYINPFYYFFLNYCKADILNYETEESDIGNPYVMDYQKEFADLLWNSRYIVKQIQDEKNSKKKQLLIKEAENIILAKARRKGLTTMLVAYLVYLLLFGMALFNVPIKIGYGYPDDDTYVKGFKPIFETILNNLPPMLKPNMVFPYNEEEIGFSYKNDEGSIITLGRLYLANFGKKDGKFRGAKLFFVFFDEAGKFPNWNRVKGATKDCFVSGGRRTGYYLLGGTSDAISNKGYKDYKDDFDNPSMSDAVSYSIYADQGMHPYIDYTSGISDRESAAKEKLKYRDKLKKAGKSETLRFEIQENPLNKDEFFQLPGGSIYDADLLTEQIKWIVLSGKDKEIIRGKLEWEKDALGKKNGKVIFVEDPLGFWMIYKNGMPKQGKKNLFIGSFDDVYKDEAPNSDSRPAMMIYKDYDLSEEESDLPVAIYLNTQKNRKHRFDDFLKGAVFWEATIFGENNDDAVVNYFENAGYLNLLMKGTNNKFGYAGNAWFGKFKSQAEDFMLKYIDTDRYKRCYFINALQELKEWGIKNTDIGICYHAILVMQNMRKSLSELEKIKAQEPNKAIRISKYGRIDTKSTVFNSKHRW